MNVSSLDEFTSVLLRKAGSVAKQVNIELVQLTRAAADFNLEDGNEDQPLNADLTWGVVTSRSNDPCRIRSEVKFRMNASRKSSGAATSESGVLVLASFVVLYSLPSFDGISDEEVDAFSKMNSVYSAWPYWREFLQNMMLRAGVQPLTLPVLRPVDIANALHEKAENADSSDQKSGLKAPKATSIRPKKRTKK